jgi:hypothetical protein
MLGLTALCVAAVTVSVLVRIARSDSEWRPAALVATLAAPLGIAVFTLAVPLQHGWARRAGTPKSLLAKTFTPVSAHVPVASPRASASTAKTLSVPFTARISGSVKQTPEAGGAIVDLNLHLSGGAHGRLRVRMAGAPLDGGGLSMTGSQVDLLADGLPSVMEGQIVSLQGQQFLARVADASGTQFDLHALLNINSQSNSVSGRLEATSAGGG